MCQLAIVAANAHQAQRIANALRSKITCNVTAVTAAGLESIRRNNFSADLWIVDFDAADQSAGRWLVCLGRINPNAAIIGIVPAEKPLLAEAFLQFGVDEVFPASALDEFPGELLEQLANKIAAQDHLADVQKRLRGEMRQSQIVAKSKAMREIMQRLPNLATSLAAVLITGETGTGKELFARAIHYLGPRSDKPFVTVDCGALPESLIENELFGHSRGAYTDAKNFSPGLIQEANGGTLFFDEVETLPLAVQSRFLHLLQEHQYRPLGQAKYIPVDVRVIAATNRDLAQAVAEKNFRQDLYYRLNVIPLFIPPLRERKKDIPALISHFVQKHAPDLADPPEISVENMQQCLAHDWPGNIRELENKVQEWLTLPASECWRGTPASGKSQPIRTLAEIRKEAVTQCEHAYLQSLMTIAHGNISGAAKLAGIHRKNLAHLLKKYNFEARHFRTA